jgi:hypothetical protein
MLEAVHNDHGRCKTDDVADDTGPEIQPVERRKLGRILLGIPFGVSVQVKSEAEGDDETGDDDIAQTEHSEVGGGSGLRREQLDRGVDALGDGHHDGRSKHLHSANARKARASSALTYPEYVVDEQ